MIQVHIEEILKCRADPLYFCENYAKLRDLESYIPATFEMGKFPEDIIKSIAHNKFTIAIGERQCGKTATITSYALWYSIFSSDSTVVFYGSTLALAQSILSKFMYSLNQLPDWLRPKFIHNNKHSVKFENGTTIVVASKPHRLKGITVGLFLVDEAAYVRDIDKLMNTVWPTFSAPNSKLAMVTSIDENLVEFDKFLENSQGLYNLVVS